LRIGAPSRTGSERTAPVKEYTPYTDIYETSSALIVLMEVEVK
jgi:hypothetical protein